jgi:hypothetical protein
MMMYRIFKIPFIFAFIKISLAFVYF